MITTTSNPDDKRIRITKLREYQQPVLDAIGVPDALFIPKMAYTPRGKNELYISFFPSEVEKGKDIYTEFTSKDYESEDPSRTLYKWKYNPHFDEEYERTPADIKRNSRYLVPVAELTKIERGSVDSVPATFDIPDADSDAPINQMTIRDLVAILTKKPVSRREWLNKLLK